MPLLRWPWSSIDFSTHLEDFRKLQCVLGVLLKLQKMLLFCCFCVYISYSIIQQVLNPLTWTFQSTKAKKTGLCANCSCVHVMNHIRGHLHLHLYTLLHLMLTCTPTRTRPPAGLAVVQPCIKKRSAALCHHCIAQATPEHHPLLTDTWTGKTPRWPWPPGDSALSSFNSNSFLSSGRIQIAVDYHEDCPGPLLSALCCICRCLWLWPSYKNDNLRQSAGRDRGVTDLSCVCVCSSSWSQWSGSRSVSLLLTCTCTLIYRHQHQCVLSTEPVLEAVNEELAAESGLCVRRTLIWQQGQKWPSLTKLVFNLWMSAEKVLTFQGRSPERWQRLRRKMLPKVVITLNSWMYLRDPANCSP